MQKWKMIVVVIVLLVLVSGISILIEITKRPLSRSSDISKGDSTMSISDSENKETAQINGRLSAIVAFALDEDDSSEWFSSPQYSCIEAWVRFPEEFGDDVIMMIDQEFLDGVDDPYHLENGDWMSFVGVQRTGFVWVASGTEVTDEGYPSSKRFWKYYNIGQKLEPDTWYLLRQVSDFQNREYVSFTVKGNKFEKTIELEGIKLDYPNAAPFDKRAMTYYVGTMRGYDIMNAPNSTAIAYFDDVKAWLMDSDGNIITQVLNTGFENSPDRMPYQPVMIVDEKIVLDNYEAETWYLERDDARVKTGKNYPVRSGEKSALCDATLRALNYDEWFSEK